MTTELRPSLMLKASLLANALFSLLCAIGLLTWTLTVAELIGRRAAEVRSLGVGLVGFATALVLLAVRRRVRAMAVAGIIVGDALWVMASLLIVRTGAFTPIGDSLVSLVAAAVAVLAAGQTLGLAGWGRAGFSAIALGIGVAATLVRMAGLPGDIRRAEIRPRVSPQQVDKGRVLLRKAAERHGSTVWKQRRAFEIEGTDEWAGLGKTRGWWPTPMQRLKMQGARASFTSRVELLDGPKLGEVWGLHAWRAYQVTAAGALRTGPNRAIEFYLPALHYFHELPFRILDAPNTAYEGSELFQGRGYDVIFATWGGFDAHFEDDQYEIWISRDSGLVEMVYYTVREGGPAAAGTIFYGDYREVDGVQVSFRQTVAPTRPKSKILPPDEGFFHQLRLARAAWLDQEPGDLRPLPGAPDGDWKPGRPKR